MTKLNTTTSNPKRLVWLTDIHLNFMPLQARKDFYKEIKRKRPDFVLITGDISEAGPMCTHLQEMRDTVKKPIYFVLGNHDYYGLGIEEMRMRCTAAFSKEQERGIYHLPSNPTTLSEVITTTGLHKTMLIGEDNLYDEQLGIPGHVILSDFRHIRELLGKDRSQAIATHAKAANNRLNARLKEVLKDESVKRVLIAIHVPPFKELSRFNGEISSQEFLPYFCAPSTGKVLLKHAKANPNVHFEVYCGHTHGKASYSPLPNLHGFCQDAFYSYPVCNESILIG